MWRKVAKMTKNPQKCAKNSQKNDQKCSKNKKNNHKNNQNNYKKTTNLRTSVLGCGRIERSHRLTRLLHTNQRIRLSNVRLAKLGVDRNGRLGVAKCLGGRVQLEVRHRTVQKVARVLRVALNGLAKVEFST